MNCTTNYLPLAAHLAAMLRKSSALEGLPIKEVTGHTSAGINCENAHLTFEDMVKLCIGTDACGKPCLRVKIISSCTLAITCANNDSTNPLGKMFAYDATAKTYALVLNRST